MYFLLQLYSCSGIKVYISLAQNIANRLLNAYTHLYIVYVHVYKLTHLQLKLNFYKWLGKIYIPFWQLYIKIPDNIFKQTSEVKQTATKTHKKNGKLIIKKK